MMGVSRLLNSWAILEVSVPMVWSRSWWGQLLILAVEGLHGGVLFLEQGQLPLGRARCAARSEG